MTAVAPEPETCAVKERCRRLAAGGCRRCDLRAGPQRAKKEAAASCEAVSPRLEAMKSASSRSSR